MSKKIAIGGDHAGYEYKSALIDSLKEWGYQPVNFGADTADSVDYPDFAHPVASAVENKEADFGVLICGSANGVAITANKHAGIRAAICWEKEIASLARLHNNANVVCIPARFIELGLAKEIVKEFLETEFEGGRHARRVDKISCI
ncbi:MAG TPA: ribose 5-phosphate isomerase B [Candidatus Sphingobacterium stercoripullorum]|uniref:Ribose 5-phosphate isomerase B n=1 Tax=Candidatus Sphingobacterium stercoripullorum TaxID=2838759 RepID=A0A9D1W9T7_9SPHI|nr:ribose 5-phosphate isomerase B [Candidatus Sphingobacterium stercoripullorum]HLR49124.1 ribose 5-phosphate isomerase B [Candidatus Sphingobacterium stercoripullorum]